MGYLAGYMIGCVFWIFGLTHPGFECSQWSRLEKAAACGSVAIWPVVLPLTVVGCVVCLGIVAVRYGKRLVAWLMERIDEGGLDAGEQKGGE